MGEKVLIPITQLKPRLDIKWLGPYQITKKVSNMTYDIDMAGRQERKRVIYANLREWRPSPSAAVLLLKLAYGNVGDVQT